MGRLAGAAVAATMAWALVAPAPALGQRTATSAAELARRREALMREVGGGLIVLFGADRRDAAAHFRQDNDFYYFAGREDVNAILVMVPRTRETLLFLPEQTAREIMVEGANLLRDGDLARRAGFAAVHPLSFFDEYLARRAAAQGGTLHLRLAPADTVDGSRGDAALFAARRWRIHYNDQITIDAYRVGKLRERYPNLALADVTPRIDALRAVKSAEEIEVLRRNGRLSAAAVREAMLASRSGAFEYEVEAAAVGAVLRGGARGPAYAPIVGSGPNSCVWHYDANGRRMEAGEVVLMDFGADLDYQAMDITRTWPVGGVFTPEQREAYRRVLAVQKACIAAYRPGVTEADVEAAVAAAVRAQGIDPGPMRGGFGHGVGMATHDVPLGEALREGMVFAIEPALYFPEKGFGVRIEDTVLITRDGAEVLTAGVPKEIDEIEALLATRPQPEVNR